MDEDHFKNLTLRDIRFNRDKIQRFLDDTMKIAENAVDKIFNNPSNPDVLENIDEMNTLLREIRGKLITVADSIPDDTTLVTKEHVAVCEEVTSSLDVPVMNIKFAKPYLVKVLLPASPSRFWLFLESTTTDKIEEELREAYSTGEHLRNLPSPGTFVICFHDGKFCRGKVVSTLEFSKAISDTVQVDVVLVDYGTTVSVPLNQLYPIQSRFCQDPANGLLCCLKDFEPTNYLWKLEGITFFTQQIQAPGLTAIFYPPPKNCDTMAPFSMFSSDFDVSLYFGESDIALAMVRKGLAKWSKSSPNLEETRSQAVLNGDQINRESPGKSKSNRSSQQRGTTQNTSDASFASGVFSLVPSDTPPEIEEQLDLCSKNLTEWKNQQAMDRPERSPPSQLNVNSKEFIPKNIFSSLTNAKSQRNQACNINQTPKSAFQKALSLEKMTNTTDFILPNSANQTMNSFCTNAQSVATTPEDIETIDEFITKPSTKYETIHEIVHRPTDRKLMEKFLNSKPESSAQSTHSQVNHFTTNSSEGGSFFTSVSRHSHVYNHQNSTSSIASKRQSKENFQSLDYVYEAVLKPRPSPFEEKIIHCYISYIKSPSEFYVHLRDEMSSQLEPLKKRLNELYHNSPKVPVTKPEVGSFWVIQESCSKCWSRAKILNVTIHEANGNILDAKSEEHRIKGTMCQVFLVDWGNEDEVEISQLRPLVKEILDIPCLAIRCRLAGIFPVDMIPEWRSNWSSEATNKFIELTGVDKELTALISSDFDEEETLSLLMLTDGDDEKFTVNETMVFQQYASSHVFAKPPETDDEKLEWDPMSDDWNSPMNTNSLNTENYDSVTTGYIPQDEKNICRFFRAQGKCYKGIKCDQLHSNPQKNVFTQDRIKVLVDLPTLPSLILGSLIHVQVTCVINASSFYCILPYGTKDLGKLNGLDSSNEDEDWETIETLQEALQIEYNDNYFLHRVSLIPPAGDIVIAKSQDRNWYRGRVMEELEKDHFGIFFVDFGNREKIHIRNLCSPKMKFSHLPAQAVEMCLNGVDVSSVADTELARNVLSSLVEGKELVAKVVHYTPYVCVDLYDVSGPKHIDIAAEMERRKVTFIDYRKMSCVQTQGKCIPG